MVALGIIAGTLLVHRLARREGINPDLVFDYIFYAAIIGILGSRAWEVVFSWSHFVQNPLSALEFWSGGLSIQGAVAAGLLFTVWFVKRHNLSFWSFADLLAPGLILGQAIGRIGCLLNGDAYGLPTNSWFGIVYQPGTPAYNAYGNMPLVPAELFEALGGLVILGILLLLLRHKPFNGIVALMYFVLYSLLRFTLEFWRGDSLLITETLKAAQVTSLVVALAAIVIIVVKMKQEARLK